jgi:hypothetical protein
MSDRSLPPENDGRVVPFRPRGTPRWRWPAPRPPVGAPHADPLAKYERGDSEDDYRHRMKMNVLGFAITIVLIVVGIWLADRIAVMRKNQDCFLSGQRNCAPIDAPMQRG